jgi:RNA-directed DNA polymerase
MILQATGKKGVPQGGVISPLLSNLYLNEVDRMLEKAVDTTRRGKYTNIQYARFADDMVILIDAEQRSDWLVKAVNRRLREEFVKLGVAINEDKSRMVDLKKGESFTFLGFEYRRILSLRRKWRPHYAPKLKKRTALFEKLREIFRQHVSWPVEIVIENQSDSPWLGELLSGRTFEFLFLHGQALGREEGQAASDACPGTQRLRLEAVE